MNTEIFTVKRLVVDITQLTGGKSCFNNDFFENFEEEEIFMELVKEEDFVEDSEDEEEYILKPKKCSPKKQLVIEEDSEDEAEYIFKPVKKFLLERIEKKEEEYFVKPVKKFLLERIN